MGSFSFNEISTLGFIRAKTKNTDPFIRTVLKILLVCEKAKFSDYTKIANLGF
jgi:hypothetical protein